MSTKYRLYKEQKFLLYNKMLLVDPFKTMIKTQCDPRISVKQSQTRQTQIRRLIDEQSDQSICVYDTVCTLLKQQNLDYTVWNGY